MKLETCVGFVAEVMPKSCWKPGSEGTTDDEPWSHAVRYVRVVPGGMKDVEGDLLMGMPLVA